MHVVGVSVYTPTLYRTGWVSLIANSPTNTHPASHTRHGSSHPQWSGFRNRTWSFGLGPALHLGGGGGGLCAQGQREEGRRRMVNGYTLYIAM